MNLAGAILVLLLGQPVAAQDQACGESPLERVNRLSDAAEGMAEASHRATCTGRWAPADVACRPLWPGDAEGLAGHLVAIGFGESRWRRDVAMAQCGPRECDGGRARSYWQLHRSRLVQWDTLTHPGPDAVREGALGAARVLAGFRHRCRQGDVGAHAGYATGLSCTWSRAVYRALAGDRIASRLRSMTR